jgi:hypothetical protein
VAVYFMALFTKQNAITLPALLVAWELLDGRRPDASLTRRLAAYLPFAALTAGYLALRYALFGQVAREEQLRADTLPGFAGMAARQLADVIVGRRDGEALLVWSAVALACALALAARGASARRAAVRTVLLFGAVWWTLGVAPVVVAGYESPRHVYLAAMGWAVLLGAAFHQMWMVIGRAWWRAVVAAAAAAVLLFYASRLHEVVDDWRTMADVSARAVRLVEAAATRSPPGGLVIAGVPRTSWEWALPFAARPPFTATDLTARVHIVSPWMLHCCRVQWLDDTRRTLAAWSQGPGREAVTVIRVDESTAATLSTDEHAALAVVARLLLDLDRHEDLDGTLRRLIESVR